MMRAFRGWPVAVPLLIILFVGCGGDDMMMMSLPPRMDVVIPPMTAQVDHIVALEGQQNFVTALIPADGALLTNARVEVDERAAPMEIVEQRCNNRRCAAVLRIVDHEPNRGTPIPAPFDANNGYLTIVADEGEWRGLISVRPLDNITHMGSDRIAIRGGMLASDVDIVEGATFEAAVTNEPIRWVMTGGGEIHGTIDVSASRSEARGGGYAGGAAAANGEGAGGGAASPGDGVGAGGGAGRFAGEDGMGASGVGGAGGAAQGVASCPNDYTASQCGASGGGGGTTGLGGAGSGSMLIVSLEPLDLSQANFIARGGYAEGAGAGGGGGGNIILAAPSWVPPESLDVAGGPGRDGGGAGGGGLVRLDVPGSGMDVAHGPLYDVGAVPRITDNAGLSIEGIAEPGARVDIVVKDGAPLANTTAGEDGSFRFDITLQPGMNRLVLSSTGEWGALRSWLGTSIDFVRPPSRPTEAFPVSGVLDVAYIPAAE